MILLGVACTGVAYLLYFRLIANVGPTRAVSVTFLIPVFGMLWGALYLGEAVTLSMLLGCGVILLGTALTLGLLRPAGSSRAIGPARSSSRQAVLGKRLQHGSVLARCRHNCDGHARLPLRRGDQRRDIVAQVPTRPQEQRHHHDPPRPFARQCGTGCGQIRLHVLEKGLADRPRVAWLDQRQQPVEGLTPALVASTVGKEDKAGGHG